MNEIDYDAIFSGSIGQDYHLLKLISPLAAEMSRLVGLAVADHPAKSNQTLQIVELGGGTGITTLSILMSRADIHILSIDNEPVMQDQAKSNLAAWATQQKLEFVCADALSALQALPTASADLVASAYTLHNFLADYRAKVIQEIWRVLKPGGKFINGDRYALDDISAHTRLIQEEVSGYFKVLVELQRMDVLQQWIVHLFSDESANHIMRETGALDQLNEAGFIDIQLNHRMQVNAVVTACKAN